MLLIALIGAIIYYRRRGGSGGVLRQYRRVPDFFRHCLQHSHLVSSNKEFKAAPNAVFFASADNGVPKSSPGPLSGSSHQFLAPHFGGNRQKDEDRLDLLENEELFGEDEPVNPIITDNSTNNKPAQNGKNCNSLILRVFWEIARFIG